MKKLKRLHMFTTEENIKRALSKVYLKGKEGENSDDEEVFS